MISDEDAVRWAAAVEAESEHPIATAITAAAPVGPDASRATDIRSLPGVGVTGSVDDRAVTVSRLVPR